MAIIGNPIISTDFPKDTFSGNGATVAFTMSIAPASVNAVIVVVSGITQDPSTYTISGTTLTFSAAPPTGTSNISVRHLGIAGSPNIAALGSIVISQFSATGTPSSSTFLRGDNSWASAGFPSGTTMLFVQTSAPTGWTKSTSHDNKALRIVSGTASTGGSVAFTTAFASQSVSGTVGTSGATTLDTSMMPSHSHTYYTKTTAGEPYSNDNISRAYTNGGNELHSGNINSTGGGGSHTHSGGSFTGTAINLAVQYVDVIIAVKD